MRIVAFVGSYLYKPEAVQLCAKELLLELARRGNDVSVITTNYEDLLLSDDGIEVFAIAPYENNFPFRVREAKTMGEKSKRFFFTSPGRIKSLAHGYNYFAPFIMSRVIEKSCLFCQKREPDCLISFSAPFEAHEIARVVKKRVFPYINWIAYEMDPFAYNYTFPRVTLLQRRLREKKVLSDADLIFTATGITEENYRKGFLLEYEEKTTIVGLPGFSGLISMDGEPRNFIDANDRDPKVRFLYAGAFYNNIRTPDSLLKLLSKADFDFEVVFCGTIDEGYFRKHEEVYKKCLFLGYMSQEEVQDQCLGADVLLDVQNDIPNQVPSKVLTYMSTGKPIVSLFSSGNDAGLSYLKNYPYHLAIEKSTVDDPEVLHKFKEFCLGNYVRLEEDSLNAIVSEFSTAGIADTLLRALDEK